MRLHATAVAAILITGAYSSAGSGTTAVQWKVEDGGNGNWYSRISGHHTWDEASAIAISEGGYLATSTSENENMFIATIDSGGSWLGGKRIKGVWTWITGETWEFTSWNCNHCHNSCQPDYSWENCVTSGCNDGIHMRWGNYGDDGQDGTKPGFVIEWDADCNNDGIVDYGQILDGSFSDVNGNGVPDCCDKGVPCFIKTDNNVLELTSWPSAVVIPHNDSINPAAAMTIEFWISTTDTAGRPITKRPGNGGAYTVEVNPNGVDPLCPGVHCNVFGYCASNGWGGDAVCGWTHLAITVDGASGISTTYINGEFIAETFVEPGCTIGQGTWDLMFGYTPGFSETQFEGKLDNIRIWQEALDQSTIRTVMNLDITPELAKQLPTLGGSWNFEDGANDATGVNNGTLSGGASIVVDNTLVMDCDNDGIPNWQEIANGSTDYNEDEIPDECQCLSDLTSDTQVNVHDLLVLIAWWGQCTDCDADIDRDGEVDIEDLLYVIGNWGNCP